MELTVHQKTVKYVIYCLCIALAGILQNTAGLLLQIGPARCFLIIPVTLILIMGEKELAAGLIGLFAGCVWDMHSAVHMGFNALFFMFVCFLIAAVMERFVRNFFITNMIAAVFTIFLYSFFYWLFFIIIKGVEGAESTLFTFYLPSAIYTAVLTPILWIILTPFKKKLNKKA